MCGRYALHASPEVVALQFGLASPPAFAPRYNIAPASQVLVVRQGGAAMLRWGLVPRWAKDPSAGAKLANARAETVAEKPSFRDAYRRRRGLVPASGFYEWQAAGRRKLPWYIRPAQGELLALAAIWERWNDLETCALVTTEANETMRPIHDRMPVIVAPADYAAWLGGAAGLLRPCPSGAIAAHRVGTAVNQARNEGAALIEPAAGLPGG
jgi:putative SOS response-associated peptidase YedK